ncbi:MAG: double-strand break repair protein AddB [Pseudomonadota bacterium]
MDKVNPTHVFNIPAWMPFLDTLAEQLLHDTGSDPAALNQHLILLPHRRACRSLKDVFLKHAKHGKPLMLPQMMALGDLDEDFVAFNKPDFTVLKTVASLERQGLLMSLIQRHQELTTQEDSHPLHAAQVVQLAQELAGLIDQVAWAGVSLDELSQLAPEDYAHHWQVTLDFLKIVAQFWPEILAEKACVDPAKRQRSLLEDYADMWRQHPPDYPVVAAGSTGTIPATAVLLNVVRSLPQGKVILPGLDRDIADAAWTDLDLCHPQYGLQHLLKRFEMSRAEVQELPILENQQHAQPGQKRAQLLSQALAPDIALTARRDFAGALQGFCYLQCASVQEEALSIAMMVRETLETQAKTVCIITPDRLLVERIKSELLRWHIVADDTAGTSLTATVPGRFLLLLAEFLCQPFSSLALLSVLKQPFLDTRWAPLLEQQVIRGRPPFESFSVFLSQVKNLEQQELYAWLQNFYTVAQPLLELQKDQRNSFAKLFKNFLRVADHLTEKKIWQGELGQACLEFCKQLIETISVFPDVARQDFPEVLQELLKGQTVRQPHGFHERVHIYGPLEARMLKADRVILASLNEGTWPGHHDTDPWLNRPMREQLGLPLPERRVGLSAHDFAHGFSAPEVVLTRSTKVGGTPTVPARWLLRIKTVLQQQELMHKVDRGEKWTWWQSQLDQPTAIKPWAQPAPRPPADVRPKKLSVTKIEIWMRDPYAIYARHILKLRPLDPLEFTFDASIRGTFLHAVLEHYLKSKPDVNSPQAANALFTLAQQMYTQQYGGSLLSSFWGHRLRRVAQWFIGQERKHRQAKAPIETWLEVPGQIQVTPAFVLTAIADRIDKTSDGALHIIDYKTGMVPSSENVRKGYASQLALETSMAQQGSFTGVVAAPVGSLSFWQLTGRTPAGAVKALKDDPEELAEEALYGLQQLIKTFADPFTPYQSCPRPNRAPKFNDYAHLARVAEWGQGGIDDNEN